MSEESKPHKRPLDIAREIVAGEYRVDDGPRLMTLGDQERMSAELVGLVEQLSVANAEVRYLKTHLETCPQADLVAQLEAAREALRYADEHESLSDPCRDRIDAVLNPAKEPES